MIQVTLSPLVDPCYLPMKQCLSLLLQVLSVDQWGLALSLLPSLAACGAAPLELRHSEDPAVLHFLCERRRGNGCPLVAATARGLMAYLYARYCEPLMDV